MDSRRIIKLENEIAAINKEAALMIPLAEELASLAEELDVANVPHGNRMVTLLKDDYKDQYKAGVKRCVGIGIVWV